MRRVLVAAVLVVCAREARSEAPAEDPDTGESVLALTSVRVVLEGTAAHFSAGFTVTVPGPAITEGILVDLPHRGLVTGATLRIAGELHRLDLAASTDVVSTFEQLGERAGSTQRRWAVRILRQSVMTTFDVAAPHAATLAVDLEMSAPTCYRRDARFVAVPKRWAAKLDAMVVHRGPPEELDAACPLDWTGDEHVWVELPATALAHGAAPTGRVGTTAQALIVGGERIARVELDLAGRLGEIPTDLATAIVIDGSRSVSARESEVQRAIVEAYLRGAPRSSVQVIAYAHTARALLPGWMTASQALPHVDRALRALDQRNGSDVDTGLAAATTWLARTGGTHRILLLTDDRLAQRFLDANPAALARLVPAGTTVHVVVVDADAQPLTRDDAITLAPIAKAGAGIAVRGGLADKAADVEMLLRPVTLDQVAITAPGWKPMTSNGGSCASLDGSLAEGGSCTWWGEGTPNGGPITVEGLVWGRRLTRVMQPDLGHSQAVARELTQLDGLAGVIAEQVEREAHAVTDHFALIGTWGGSEGYADVDHGGFGFGTSGCGCGGDRGGSIGIGTGGTLHVIGLDLKHQLDAAIASCHRGDHHVEITLETTLEEIVGVELEIPHAADDSIAALHACIEAAIWDTAITIPNAPGHHTTVVDL